MKIIVVNEKVVSDYLGFPLKNYEDLLENKECDKFIKENKSYIKSITKKDLLEFYHKTGIILEHEFPKSGYLRINMLGLVSNDYNKLYFAHLIVIDDQNVIKIEDNFLYLNGKKERNIKEELDIQKNMMEKFQKFNKELEDNYLDYENLIKKYFPHYQYIKYTNQLILTPFNDILTLTDDGILYCNNKVYRTNVDYVFEENVMNKIIVYNDQSIEYLTVNFESPLAVTFNPLAMTCNKVLYSTNCLIMLYNKKLAIIIKEYDYLDNKSHGIMMNGIDDVEFKSDDQDELILIVGKERIMIDLIGSCIHEVDYK